jgi:hypothetical protein
MPQRWCGDVWLCGICSTAASQAIRLSLLRLTSSLLLADSRSWSLLLSFSHLCVVAVLWFLQWFSHQMGEHTRVREYTERALPLRFYSLFEAFFKSNFSMYEALPADVLQTLCICQRPRAD